MSNTIDAYRITITRGYFAGEAGSSFLSLEPWGGDDRTFAALCEPVRVTLPTGYHVDEGGDGARYLYDGAGIDGITLAEAARAGLVTLA